MRIYLSQHGEALPKDEDVHRPLSAQGREDIARVAGFLSLFMRPQPQCIYHSGKLRAEQSAMMFSEAWGSIPRTSSALLEPKAHVEGIMEVLNGQVGDCMLVGHLPHLQRLAGLMLCADAESSPVVFRHGGVVCLESCIDSAGNRAGYSLLWSLCPTLFYGE